MAFSESVAALGLQTPWDDLITAMGGDASSIALVKGVIATESGWNPSAVNPADPSYGLMQILAGSRGPYPSVLISDLMDPSTNITLGSTYLKNQISRFGFPGGIAAYNSGTPRTLPGGQYVNQAYVDSVLSYQSYYLNAKMGQVNYGVGPDATLTDTGGYVPPDPGDPFVDPTVAESPDGSIFSSPTFDIGALIALGVIGVGIVIVSQK
jgi:hypothetical protein